MSDSLEILKQKDEADGISATKDFFVKKRKSILVIVSSIIAILLVVYLFFGGNYKYAVEKYINANYYGDFDSALNLLPKEALNEMLDSMGISKSEYSDQLQKTQADIKTAYLKEYGEDYTVSYKIIRKEKYDSGRFGDLKESLKEFGITKSVVSTAYSLDVEITVKGSKRNNEFKENLTAVKINYKWYIL